MPNNQHILEYLSSNNIRHELLSAGECFTGKQTATALAIPHSQVVRTIIVNRMDAPYLVSVGEDCILDYEALETQLDASTKVINAGMFPRMVEDMAGGQYPLPLGTRYKMPWILDETLGREEVLYLPIGDVGELLRVSRDDLLSLQQSTQTLAVARTLDAVIADRNNSEQKFKRRRIIELLDNIEGLPAMPEMALRLIEVSNNPNADANHLGKVIEVDPSLSAQIMSYANSAFYGYRGKISSVREAIARVLGFEMVANLAIGIAMGKSFSIPAQGPLGLSTFWRHAVYCSALTERLVKAAPKTEAIQPGLAYMCGLLHNFGHLLLGHVYMPGFRLLNRSILANPGIDIIVLEEMLLGLHHGEIGRVLLENWEMPDEAIISCEHHHNGAYDGPHAAYSHMVLLADRLLWVQDIGEASSSEIPALSLQTTGLNANILLQVMEPLLEACVDMDNLATQISG